MTTKKLRGGYYTPFPIAVFLAKWALGNGSKSVLEPSCGDGVFLRAIRGLLEDQFDSSLVRVEAVEILSSEARKARRVASELKRLGVATTVRARDYLEWVNGAGGKQEWDAVIGNPPYIRYQSLVDEQQESAAMIFERAGVRFRKTTNAWVPFVISSVMSLRPGGRLGMVLPAELLHIMHADGLRLLLEQEMEAIDLIDIRELVFEKTLQGVVLMRAKRHNREFERLRYVDSSTHLVNVSKGINGSSGLSIQAIRDGTELDKVEDVGRTIGSTRRRFEGKWTRALLSRREIGLLEAIEKEAWTREFVEVANVDIGIVTGANDFFVVDQDTISRNGFEGIALPMVRRSEQVRGIAYTVDDHLQNKDAELPVYLLHFPDGAGKRLSSKMKAYISAGEKQGLHTRTKCGERDPWYVVNSVWSSDVSLFKRSHKFPRLILNEAAAYTTDGVYRISMRSGFEGHEKTLVFSFLNSASLLSAELEGRHYGGGVLELVPSEIESLLLPWYKPSDEEFRDLDVMLRSGMDLNDILDFTDPLILGRHISERQIAVLRGARDKLARRRMRSRKIS